MKDNPYLPKLSRCSADYQRAVAFLSAGLDGSEEECRNAQQRNAAIIDKVGEGHLFSGVSAVRVGYVSCIMSAEEHLLYHRMCAVNGHLKRVTLGYIAFMERIGQYIEKEGQTL